MADKKHIMRRLQDAILSRVGLPSGRLVIGCRRHRNSNGTMRPRSACAVCWSMWLAKGNARVEFAVKLDDCMKANKDAQITSLKAQQAQVVAMARRAAEGGEVGADAAVREILAALESGEVKGEAGP